MGSLEPLPSDPNQPPLHSGAVSSGWVCVCGGESSHPSCPWSPVWHTPESHTPLSLGLLTLKMLKLPRKQRGELKVDSPSCAG